MKRSLGPSDHGAVPSGAALLAAHLSTLYARDAGDGLWRDSYSFNCCMNHLDYPGSLLFYRTEGDELVLFHKAGSHHIFGPRVRLVLEGVAPPRSP